ncbi:hypothetical protein DAY19_07580 [Halobacteriovorax vibrionivorans]|uniref:Peptidase M48 domain-containing protein n=1 Tax=Halobacteriovorax vibrionivorans TaxID=2152716 RepID=A0ABY0IG31_9BACT|nr:MULTISPECIES: hypothetical protein [Halobacteriovorax]RZF21540.1 hypothetical protein DAY19_07580 [Halobacteriovorax vibrionivorans]TGD49167.1 hypothetical protein EP118_01470 [Halobacteriovorax sp. Y22]
MNNFLATLLLSTALLNLNSFAKEDHQSFLKISMEVQQELQCEREFQIINKAFKVRSKDFVDCEDAFWADRAMSKVKQISNISPKVNLELLARDSGASFDIGSTIRLPLRLTFSNRWGQVYDSLSLGTDAILYHEYSHAIFGEVIGKKFYPQFKAMAETLSRYKIALQNAYATGNYGNAVKYYENQIKRLQEKMKTHHEIEYYHLSSSYNEFFADLVAVLVTNNANSIFNALYYDEMSDQSYQMIKLRSFEDQSTNYDNRLLNEIHGELALARQFIGKTVLNEIFSIRDEKLANQRKKALLDNVLKAIDNQMTKRIELNDFGISPKKNNEKLIKELKEVLKLEV